MSTAKDYLATVSSKYSIALPSGAVFKIRRPNTFWFASHVNSLPTAAIAEAEEATSTNQYKPAAPQPSFADIQRGSDITRLLVFEHVIEPKIGPKSDPENGVVGIDDLDPDDAQRIFDYLYGKVDGAGNPVADFPDKRGAADDSARG